MDEDHKNQKVAIITGATGFVGSNLAARLVKDGWSVHAIVRPDSNLASLGKTRDAVCFHVHSGGTQALTDIVGSIRPSVIFHLASLFLSQHEMNDVESLIQSNVTFSTQLLEAMAQHQIPYFINTGTSWQYSVNSGYSPVNLYAATKQAFQDIVEYYCSAHQIKATTLALFDTYGRGDTRKKLIALLWQTARSQQPLLLSPGAQMLDMVHIDDVVDAFLLSAAVLPLQNKSHVIYGVSSERPMQLTELVKCFEAANKVKLPITFGGRPYRDREVMMPWNTYELLPGWKAKIRFEDGITQTIPTSD